MLQVKHKILYRPDEDIDLALYNGSCPTFFGCREELHAEYEDGDQILAKCKPHLVREVERKLKLSIRKCATFTRTDLKGWLCVSPNWWKDDYARFGLFSILLKESRRYKRLSSAVRNSSYLRHTKAAVERFLARNVCSLHDSDLSFIWSDVFTSDAASNLLLITEKKKKHFDNLTSAQRKKMNQICNLIQDDDFGAALAAAYRIISQ